MLIYRKKI